MEKLNLLFALVRDYLTHYLPIERKFSENTIRSYKKALGLLLDYVKAQKKISLGKVTFEMIDRNMLSAFLDNLENEPTAVQKHGITDFTVLGLSMPMPPRMILPL